MRNSSLIAILLVFLGVACMAASGSILFNLDFKVLFKTFLLICIMIAIPIVVFAVIYFFIRSKGEDESQFK